MKASLASGVLLLVVVLLVMGNALYMDHVIGTLGDMVAALPDKPCAQATDRIVEIIAYLEKKESFLSLSVPYPTLDRGIELCKSLRRYAEDNALVDYTATKIILADAIEDMGRLERVEWKNIF